MPLRLSQVSAWCLLWPRVALEFSLGLTTQQRIVASARAVHPCRIQGIASLAEKAEAPACMGSRYVREAVEEWLDYLAVERQLAVNTAEAYERDISQFLAFLAAHLNRLPDMKQLLALQARDVRAFLAARRGEGVGSRSLARSLCALRMFYRFLERRGYGKNDAIRSVSLPKLPHSVPKPLTAPKATALVDGADIASPDAPEWIAGARHRRTVAALRLRPAYLRGAVAQAQRCADQRPRHAASDRARATRRASFRCCRSCARRSSTISSSAR